METINLEAEDFFAIVTDAYCKGCYFRKKNITCPNGRLDANYSQLFKELEDQFGSCLLGHIYILKRKTNKK